MYLCLTEIDRDIFKKEKSCVCGGRKRKTHSHLISFHTCQTSVAVSINWKQACKQHREMMTKFSSEALNVDVLHFLYSAQPRVFENDETFAVKSCIQDLRLYVWGN